MERVNSTIQISTAGISPGGGVGNTRKSLTKETLGVDVIAIGVPTVVDAATLTIDVLDMAIDNLIAQSEETESFYEMLKNLKKKKISSNKRFVRPIWQELNSNTKGYRWYNRNLSIIISEGLNRSLHPGRLV